MSTKVVNDIDLPELTATSESAFALGDRMDLVEHVKVKVTVTLGSTEMLIGRLFALTAGEVIPLDRDVDAPVDIRLHGKVIARGQLVAVGDKFGVSVTEILGE